MPLAKGGDTSISAVCGRFGYHQMRVIPYLAKRRAAADTLVFIFTTGDEYMRRAFLRRGWIENPVANSQLFDLRWDLNENAVPFEELRPGQLCNHFPNNQELTTKTGLARNLPRLADCDCNPEAFFPRCYDFTDERQIEAFMLDFQRTAIVNLVKRHAQYFKLIHGAYPLFPHHSFRILTEIKREERRANTSEWQNRLRSRYKGVYLSAPDSSRNVLNLTLLKAAVAFLRYQIKLRTGFVSESGTEKWFKRSRGIRNAFEALAFVGTYPLPYSAQSVKEISVSSQCFAAVIGTNTRRRMGRAERISGTQGHRHSATILRGLPTGEGRRHRERVDHEAQLQLARNWRALHQHHP